MPAFNQKTIIRAAHNRENPYVMIRKDIFTDPNLSFCAKGLLCYLLSRPDNWKVSIVHLATVGPDKHTKIGSSLKELAKFGYIEINKVRNENGRFDHVEYLVHEVPKNPSVELTDNLDPPADDEGQEEGQNQESTVSGFSTSGETTSGAPTSGESPTTNKRDLKNNDFSNYKKIQTKSEILKSWSVSRVEIARHLSAEGLGALETEKLDDVLINFLPRVIGKGLSDTDIMRRLILFIQNGQNLEKHYSFLKQNKQAKQTGRKQGEQDQELPDSEIYSGNVILGEIRRVCKEQGFETYIEAYKHILKNRSARP